MEVTYNLYITSNIEQGIHFHPEIELLYVMSGHAELKTESSSHILYKDEIYLINFGTNHQIFNAKNCVLAVLKFDYTALLKITGQQRYRFRCDTFADVSRSHYNLKKYFGELLRFHLIGDRKLQEFSAFFSLLYCLTEEYAEKTSSGKRGEMDTRMEEVLLYINLHYREPLKLNDICQKFYFAPSTFTRAFKANTSMSFIQYLHYLRVHHSREELLYTSKSVTQIALDNGFNDLPIFNKVFKKTFGITPAACRKQELKQAEQSAFSSEEIQIIEKDYIHGTEQRLSDSQNVIRKRAILDCRKHHPYKKIWNQAVSVGSAHDLLSAEQQKQLCRLRDEIGCHYVRLPHLFAQEMQLRESDSATYINFDTIDNILDFIVKNQMKPFIVIGDRPSPVIPPDKKTRYGESEEPFFKDIEDYRFVVETVLQHIMVRYGAETSTDWIWEIQYNPVRDTPKEYFEQFRIAASFIKNWVPDAKIGGYGHLLCETAIPLLSEWAKQEFQPNFFSVSAYPYEKTESLKNRTRFTRVMDPRFFLKQVRRLKEELMESGLENLPIYFTEWNLSWADTNYVNDSCAKACQMLKIMLELLEEIALGIYDLASDLSIRNRATNRPLFGGQGLLSRDGLSKPAFYALTSLKFAGNKLIKCEKNYIFTMHGKNLLFGLCYNDKPFNMNYYNKSESEITLEDLETIYENNDDLDQQFLISGLQDGLYCVKRGAFNEKNSILRRWMKMGSSEFIDMNDLDYLKQVIQMDITIMQEKVIDGTLTFSVKIPPHEFSIINIYPLKLDNK